MKHDKTDTVVYAYTGVYTCYIHGIYMVYAWYRHGICMVYTWYIHGIYIWYIHGIYMVYTWLYLVIPYVSQINSLVLTRQFDAHVASPGTVFSKVRFFNK